MLQQLVAGSTAIFFSLSFIPYGTPWTTAWDSVIAIQNDSNQVWERHEQISWETHNTVRDIQPVVKSNDLNPQWSVKETPKPKPKPTVLAKTVTPEPNLLNFKNDFECTSREVTKKIEFHYTAENYDEQKTDQQKLEAIYRAHTSPNWKVQGSWIGYHYVIMKSGQIYRTRNVECTAIADAGWDVVEFDEWKWTTHNAERIHIAFVGTDKPTKAQTDSMVYLANTLAKRFKLSKDDITSHAEEAPKNHKESLEYWFGSRKAFLDKLMITKQKKIYRNWQYLDYLQHWYEISNGDMDFIKTINQESSWDLNASGDKNKPSHGDYAWWLCQLNSHWRASEIADYKKMSPNQKVEFCYKKYSTWLKDWVIENQLKGYKKRNTRRNDIFTVR